MTDYQSSRLNRKLGLEPPLPTKKERKAIPKVSAKKKAKDAAEKEARNGGETEKQKWFNDRRQELVGVCQCGCGRKSSKHEDDHFRASICHILPQRLFPSVATHRLNFVERNFWDGCHFRMDNKSMDLWPQMADFDDIKSRFLWLSNYLTESEKKKKFYTHLKTLVYGGN